jgi:hypothetical protein
MSSLDSLFSSIPVPGYFGLGQLQKCSVDQYSRMVSNLESARTEARFKK